MFMNLFNLKNKVAVVTGGSLGIGRAISLALSAYGACVIPTSRSEKNVENIVQEIKKNGGKALSITTDISNYSNIEALVEEIKREYGKIDILVNNAGTGILKEAEKITQEELSNIIDVNLKGVFYCCQIVGKEMIRAAKGKIINISSVMGILGPMWASPYAATKGGVISLTKALSIEWSKYNINVNCIAPGYFLTEMTKDLQENEKIYNSLLRRIPLKRFGVPNDIAGISVFLASEASNYITGEIITIDGGLASW